MFKLTENPSFVKCIIGYGEILENMTFNDKSRFWTTYQEWLAEGNIPEPAFSLDELKESKKGVIRKAFEDFNKIPITASNGKEYDAGMDSVLRLDGAKRLSQQMGQNDIVFYGVANDPHTLTFPEAEQVINEIGASYQNSFSKKQSLFKAIDVATNETELNAIHW